MLWRLPGTREFKLGAEKEALPGATVGEEEPPVGAKRTSPKSSFQEDMSELNFSDVPPCPPVMP